MQAFYRKHYRKSGFIILPGRNCAFYLYIPEPIIGKLRAPCFIAFAF